LEQNEQCNTRAAGVSGSVVVGSLVGIVASVSK
jgi:hypothetical protein